MWKVVIVVMVAMVALSSSASPPVQADFVGTINLGLKILKEFSNKSNAVHSPGSVWAALALSYMGAAADTKGQLGAALNVNSPDSVIHMLNIMEKQRKDATGRMSKCHSSRVFKDKNLNIDPDVERKLRSRLVPIDVTKPEHAAKAVNNFVQLITRGLIMTTVEPDYDQKHVLITSDAGLVNGVWIPTPVMTCVSLFYPFDQDPVPVKMMYIRDRLAYGYSSSLAAHIIKLPVRVSQISLFIFAPQVWGKEGFQATMDALNVHTFKYSLQLMDITDVIVHMPSFIMTASYSEQLAGALEQLGMSNMFDDKNADFSLYKEKLHIKKTYSETVFQVSMDALELAMSSNTVLFLNDSESATIHGASKYEMTGNITKTCQTTIKLEIKDMSKAGDGQHHSRCVSDKTAEEKILKLTLTHPFIFVVYEEDLNLMWIAGAVVAPEMRKTD